MITLVVMSFMALINRGECGRSYYLPLILMSAILATGHLALAWICFKMRSQVGSSQLISASCMSLVTLFYIGLVFGMAYESWTCDDNNGGLYFSDMTLVAETIICLVQSCLMVLYIAQ